MRTRAVPTAMRWAPVVGLGALLAGALGPWLRSGRTERNSYQLIASAGRLDVLDRGGERLLAALWLLLPVALVVGAAAVRARRSGMAAVVAVAAGLTGLALVRIVGDLPFPTRWGLTLTRWAAVFSIMAGPMGSWADRNRSRPERQT